MSSSSSPVSRVAVAAAMVGFWLVYFGGGWPSPGLIRHRRLVWP